MQHPLLTLAFDLFLVGSALCIAAAVVAEALDGRQLSVGRVRRARRAPARVVEARAWRPVIYRPAAARRRAA